MFHTPFSFWYNFIFLFLFCGTIQAFIQCHFLIRFAAIKNKPSYYLLYLGLSYLALVAGLFISISENLSTLIGIAIVFLFTTKILNQKYITAAIISSLVVTTNVLVESILPPLWMLLQKTNFLSPIILQIVEAVFMLILNYFILLFFAKRYNLKVNEQSEYMLLLILPLVFICIVMRTLTAFQYPAVYTNHELVSHTVAAEDIQFLIIGIAAFLCVCGSLYAYEKIVHYVKTEYEKNLLEAQLDMQRNYVEEAKMRYNSTRTFRHDFKNHIIALTGLVEKKDISKIESYLDRFQEISKEISFEISTGNTVIDILLNEKIPHAKKLGIDVKLDVEVPATVCIDDFDLCAVFSNAVDNAIKGCNSIKTGNKSLNITAKQHNHFFIIDIFNTFEASNVEKGSGIGLSTIKMVAEKYQGVVEITKEDGIFRISIILPFK